MRQSSTLLAVLASAALGACATQPPPEPVPPTLVLSDYVEGAPRDAACEALIEQALVRHAGNGFKLIGKLNTRTYPRPGEPRVQATPHHPLTPVGSHPAGAPMLRMDGTRNFLYVNCEAREAYIAQRGGVIDITYWFGPFVL